MTDTTRYTYDDQDRLVELTAMTDGQLAWVAARSSTNPRSLGHYFTITDHLVAINLGISERNVHRLAITGLPRHAADVVAIAASIDCDADRLSQFFGLCGVPYQDAR